MRHRARKFWCSEETREPENVNGAAFTGVTGEDAAPVPNAAGVNINNRTKK